MATHILHSINDKSSHALVERPSQTRGIATRLRVLWSVAKSRTNEKKWKVSKSIGGVLNNFKDDYCLSWESSTNKTRHFQSSNKDKLNLNSPLELHPLTHLKLIIQSLLKDTKYSKTDRYPHFSPELSFIIISKIHERYSHSAHAEHFAK